MHKMPGDRYNQFAGLRVMETYKMTHPGKKLDFMGNEFGQFLEWRVHSELEWKSLDDEMNNKHSHFTKTLNELYKKERALWEVDHDSSGIEILDADNADQSILTFVRKGKKHVISWWLYVILCLLSDLTLESVFPMRGPMRNY